MANLYAQVQTIEQRLLMLEEYILKLSLHLNPNGQGGAPVFNPQVSGFFGPRSDQSYGEMRKRPDNWSSGLQHEVAFNEVSDEVADDHDFASLAANVEGVADTDVSGPGGFGVGDDMGGLGDDGDAGGDASGDAGGDF